LLKALPKSQGSFKTEIPPASIMKEAWFTNSIVAGVFMVKKEQQ
jgi:hypothetical protein